MLRRSEGNETWHRLLAWDGELTESATCKKSLQVQNEGSRTAMRSVKYYSLDMILAIGYRVRSNIGVQFRNWEIAIP